MKPINISLLYPAVYFVALFLCTLMEQSGTVSVITVYLNSSSHCRSELSLRDDIVYRVESGRSSLSLCGVMFKAPAKHTICITKIYYTGGRFCKYNSVAVRDSQSSWSPKVEKTTNCKDNGQFSSCDFTTQMFLESKQESSFIGYKSDDFLFYVSLFSNRHFRMETTTVKTTVRTKAVITTRLPEDDDDRIDGSKTGTISDLAIVAISIVVIVLLGVMFYCCCKTKGSGEEDVQNEQDQRASQHLVHPTVRVRAAEQQTHEDSRPPDNESYPPNPSSRRIISDAPPSYDDVMKQQPIGLNPSAPPLIEDKPLEDPPPYSYS